MAGSSAADGERDLKGGVLAFGAMIWAGPVFAQPQDPLAPLPADQTPAVQPSASTQGQSPSGTAPLPTQPPATGGLSPSGIVPLPPIATPAPPPAPTVAAPKDWRG